MIFVDTGAFLARFLKSDQFHERALKEWRALEGKRLLTTNHVLDETITLLARKSTQAFAIERARTLYASSALSVAFATPEDEERALNIMAKLADQQLSFTDCISFAVIESRSIKRAFTFDRHFALARVEIIPTA